MIECQDALQWLEVAPPSAFDVVFLDPPFASTVLPRVCRLLASKAWLAPDASIYIEAPADAPLSFLPPAWRILRSKRAGQVGYHLARCSPPTASSH